MKKKKLIYRTTLTYLIAIAAVVSVVKLGDSNNGWAFNLGVCLIALGGSFVLIGLVIKLIRSHRKI